MPKKCSKTQKLFKKCSKNEITKCQKNAGKCSTHGQQIFENWSIHVLPTKILSLSTYQLPHTYLLLTSHRPRPHTYLLPRSHVLPAYSLLTSHPTPTDHQYALPPTEEGLGRSTSMGPKQGLVLGVGMEVKIRQGWKYFNTSRNFLYKFY